MKPTAGMTCLLAIAAPMSVHAQQAAAPEVHPDDTWTYQGTVENRRGWHQSHTETTVVRVSASAIAVSNRETGSTMPPIQVLTGPDWSRIRNIAGHETVVNRPLDFPLSVGKTWTVEYSEPHPNREHASETFKTTYRVIGWENISVPAGSFHALKIEGEGEWSAIVAPGITNASGARVDAQGTTTVMQTNRAQVGPIGGRLYKAFWYVPDVKRWVKSSEEYYAPNGSRNEDYEEVLERYKVAP